MFFDPFYRARQGPLYSACRDQCFTVLPLNRLCLVWVYLPIVQNPCQTEVNPFCLFCAPRTHFVSACRGLFCHDANFLSPHTQSMHSTVPSQIASFGWSIIPAGRTSQKRLEQGPKIDLFPSPHHQTTPPFTFYLWPMAPPCPILAGYRLVVPGPCACFPFKFVQESTCCSCVCRNLETLRLRFLAFHAGFLLLLRSNQKLGFV